MPQSGYPVWPFGINHDSTQALGLIHWWPSHQPGNRVVYDLARGNHGTTINARAYDARWGQGLATTNGILLQNGISLSANASWSIAWIAYAAGEVSLMYNGTYRSWWNPSGTARWEYNGNPYLYESITTAKPANTYSVVATNVGATRGFRLYSHGAVIKTSTLVNGREFQFTSFPSFFAGFLGDIRVYNRTLSEAEAYALCAPNTRWELYWNRRRQYYFTPVAAAFQATWAAHSNSQVGLGVN